jgi:TPR repeat protein
VLAPAEAGRLLSKGAGAGHAASMVDLGVIYYNRKNEADRRNAAMWYVRATDRGNASHHILRNNATGDY